MNISKGEILERIRKVGGHVTEQRVAVMEYLASVKSHPTAKEIYDALQSRGIKISRASVFNVLNFLTEHGLAREIKTADESHYDAYVDFHPHFICRVCGKVYDLDVSYAGFEYGGLPHRVEQIDLVVTGVCQECLRNQDSTSRTSSKN